MSRKVKVALSGAAVLILLAAIITVICSRWEAGYKTRGEEPATPPPASSGGTAPPGVSTRGPRPEYPDWEEIVATTEPGASSEPPPQVTYPGGGDLDENGQPLPPYTPPSLPPLPIYQNESETGP